MPKYVRFQEDQDLVWLQNVVDRYVLRIKNNPSMHVGDDIEVILRIHDSLHSAGDITEAKLMGVPSEIVTADAELEASKKAARKADRARRPKASEIALCKEHPQYTAQRVTSRDCDGCWNAYKLMHPLDYPLKRKQFERKYKKPKTKKA